MTSPCRECFRRCCPNQLLGQPDDPYQQTTTHQSRYDFISTTALSLNPNMQFTNHESIPPLDQSFSNMTRAYPNYPKTDQADRIREHEYSHLTLTNHVCLDYNGHGLFSYAQQLHWDTTFFNIIYKSVNLYMHITRGGHGPEFETMLKERIFRFMNISSDEYSLVFTANQMLACKVLADAYPFQTNRNLLTVYDHENEGVEAMIESCRRRSGRAEPAGFSWPNMRIMSKRLRKLIMSKNKNKKKKKRGLFVFPLQSRVTGSRYSYYWMGLAQENGWDVCLDASAFGAKDMETLGLSLLRSDFLICSFYKVFGENPSGFGCLFIKKSRSSLVKNSAVVTGLVNIVHSVNRPLFLEESRSTDHGKTVLSSSSSSSSKQETFEIQEIKKTKTEIREIEEIKEKKTEIQEIEEIKEEKTELSFFEIWKRDVLVEIKEKARKNEASTSGAHSDIEFRGLDHADSLGLLLISTRVRYLVNWLVNAFGNLKHPHSEDGVPLVRIYGPKVRVDRGPVVSFNVFDWKGEKVDPTLVQKLAGRHNISLSYAVLKNVNFVDKSSEDEIRSLTKKKEGFDLGLPVVMVTLGFLTNFEDVYRLWAFVSRFLDADFVEKERWRYMSINQTTIEI
ncbi:uncharacterized protein LOC143572343 [Bidens hawaiensis]|uniref:uncharacterized protein LOC143572343 n=1 Tax=Bidens hawaiensis TaxID=980011 RepID=UPI00404A80FB